MNTQSLSRAGSRAAPASGITRWTAALAGVVGVLLWAQAASSIAADAPVGVIGPRIRPEARLAGEAVSALSKYQIGAERDAVVAIESYVRKYGHAEAAKNLEAPLVALLTDADVSADAKDIAVRVLGQIATAKSVPALRKQLEDPATAAGAVRVLFAIAGPEADAALRDGLKTAPQAERLAIVNALGRRRSASAVANLAAIAGGTDAGLAAAALTALGDIGNEDALKRLSKLRAALAVESDRLWALLTAADRLVAEGNAKAAAGALRFLVADERPGAVRVAAAHLLVASGDAAAWQTVSKLMRDADPSIRLSAATLPVRFSDVAIITRAGDRLGELEIDARVAFLESLASRPCAESRTVLIGATGVEDNDVRTAAVHALGGAGDVSSIATLLAITTQRGAVAAAAADSLARLPGEAASERLLALLREDGRDAATRAVLFEALGHRLHRPAFAVALAATNDPADEVRNAALWSAGMLAGPEDFDTVLDLFERAQTAAARRSLQRALSSALATVSDEDAAARQLVARLPAAGDDVRPVFINLLASLQAAAALERLSTDLKSDDPERRKEVLRALGNARNWSSREMMASVARSSSDTTEKVLALRGLLDLMRETSAIEFDEKVGEYRKLWDLAEREEERSAILAALRRHSWHEEGNAMADELEASVKPAEQAAEPPPPASSPR